MFSIELGEDGNVRLNGRLDAAQCAKAEEFLGTVDGPSTLDFAQLEYISSAGLGILLKTQKRLVENGAGLIGPGTVGSNLQLHSVEIAD